MRKPHQKDKTTNPTKSPHKKKYCVSILLFIYKNHIKTMVLEEHCKHTTRFLETDFSSVIAP